MHDNNTLKYVTKMIIANETITDYYIIYLELEVCTGKVNQKSHFSTENCYLKLSGQFEREKPR